MELDLQTAKIALEGLLNKTETLTTAAIRSGVSLRPEFEAKIKALEDFIKEEEDKLVPATAEPVTAEVVA